MRGQPKRGFVKLDGKLYRFDRTLRGRASAALGRLGYALGLQALIAVYVLMGLTQNGIARKSCAGILEWCSGKAETKLKKPAEIWLALCTVEVKESMTGTTITELKYPAYKRLALKPADISEATEANPSVQEMPLAEKTFPAVASEGGTVISWATCTAETVGDLIHFGQATSTVISSTQTPPTIAAKAIKVELKSS